MIKNWYVTGDTHGQVNSRLQNLNDNPSETAVIILGDAGINYYLDGRDKTNKANIQSTGFTVYCVRGNHEVRPQSVIGIKKWFDPEVKDNVWREEEFPNIRYLMDGHEYFFNDHKTLVIGGAYSVDKWFRIQTGKKWFIDEQLSELERGRIRNETSLREYDFVLTHTCPINWQPHDLFLKSVDQSMVDSSTERWLKEIQEFTRWKVWLFAHYHGDRYVQPQVEMLYQRIENLEDVFDRWTSPDSVKPKLRDYPVIFKGE